VGGFTVEVAKITSKGQITIPISIRRRLGINEGDKVLFIYKPEGVMMVNPNSLHGSASDEIVEAAETEMAAEAVSEIKERKSVKQPPKKESQVVTAQQDDNTYQATAETYKEPVRETALSPALQSVSVPVSAPPPPKEQKQVGGLDLSSLLDDIRSIGSNI